ncbi:MAG TPA: Gfo/Idh/MocA family oxidoreductase [Lacunisphaera sp.]|nr:Gfo/Idh/MocA family oxidoreductase [Lacunisphaera sp.]
MLPPHGKPEAGFDRRDFVKTLSAAGLALGAAPAGFAQAVAPRRRFAIVGCGSRHKMYQNAIETTYKEHAQLVGLCDLNAGRIEVARKLSAKNGAPPPPGYAHTDFDKMVRETKPDFVIVTTVDSTHDDYIVRAMELGCDAITEKPLTNTAPKCQRILDAVKRTGRHLRVTFNYRYSPPRTQVKDILMSGEIGDVLSMDFHWMLNTTHGADYFRRWHSHKEFSQGLMLHKASHHFDLANWWLGAFPETVWAVGKKEFYTPTMAKRFGLKSHHDRCHTCPEKDACGLFFDLAGNPDLKEMYLDQEKYDGYVRDQCVWRPEIDIEDTMNVMVRYDNGVTMSYSLNAFNAWEGYHVMFNGTKGRLEHTVVEQIYVNGGSSDDSQGAIADGGVTTRVIPLRGSPRKLEAWTGTGSHGGGDKVMLDEIFLPDAPPDKYLRASNQYAGAASILIGVAANECFKTGQPVKIASLVKDLESPKYAPMPSRTGPLPMPERAKIRRGVPEGGG